MGHVSAVNQPHPIIKTQSVVSALRNAASPASRLAVWQSLPLYSRRKSLADYYVKTATMAERRKARIAESGPELSAPEAEKPLLWLSGESDSEVMDAFPGRDFLDHRGWFSDEFQYDTLETYAVRLKRFPRLVFYGVMSEGGLRIELSEWEEIDFSDVAGEWEINGTVKNYARQLVRSNDSSTQREAEDEREYQRKWRVENDIAENRETLATLRHEIRALCHELKQLCPLPLASEFPAAAKAVRDALKSLLRDRREIMEKNAELSASL